jgi:peptidoglycan/xylan/chitin deacetylase (PgdA/CDA1 family)
MPFEAHGAGSKGRAMASIAGACKRVRHKLGSSRWRTWSVFPPRQLVDMPDGGRRRGDRVALTFDDGPHPDFTPALLDVLKRHGALATFFMCGVAIRRFPDVVKRVASEGHTIGGHSWTHRRLTKIEPHEFAQELDATHELIEALTGSPVRLFRPPYGDYNKLVLEELTERALTPALWTYHASDWTAQSERALSGRLIGSLRPGAIVLLHDSAGDGFVDGECDLEGVDRMPTVNATDELLAAIAHRRLTTVPL